MGVRIQSILQGEGLSDDYNGLVKTKLFPEVERSLLLLVPKYNLLTNEL